MHQIENEMSEALEKKNFTKCNELFEKTKNMFDDLSSKPHVKRYVTYKFYYQRKIFSKFRTIPDNWFFFVICYVSHDERLPSFLRCYTASAVCVRILSQAVDFLQQTKRHLEAVDLRRKLRAQCLYHLSWRGRWSERLALNLDYHLKRPADVIYDTPFCNYLHLINFN